MWCLCLLLASCKEINKSGIKSEITFMFDFAKSAFTVHWQHNFPTRKKEEVLFLLSACSFCLFLRLIKLCGFAKAKAHKNDDYKTRLQAVENK